MKLAGRGDKPSAEDFEEAISTLDLILKNWAVNHGVALWDIACKEVSFEAGELCTNNGQTYLCIKTHHSTADNEPGVGEDWADYWLESGETSTSTLAWVLGANYLAKKTLNIEDIGTYEIALLYYVDNGELIRVTKIKEEDMPRYNPLQPGDVSAFYLAKDSVSFQVRLIPQPTKDYTFKAYLCKKPVSINSGSLNAGVDVQDNWLIAAMYALAVELAFLYGLDTQTISGLISKATYEFKKCLGTAKSGSDLCFVKPTY